MRNNPLQSRRARLPFVCAVVIATLLPLGLQAQTTTQPQTQPAAGGTLERVRSAGKLVLGYRTDSPPMSYRDTRGKPAGYAVALCQKIAEAVESQLQLPALAVEWVAVTAQTGLEDVQNGRIDLLCAAESASLAQREKVSFSTPIFPGGIAGLLRANTPAELQNNLENRPEPYKPIWRGTPPAAFQHRTASVVAGTEAAELLAQRVIDLKIIMTISTEESYAAGVAKVVQGKSDVLFGDRAQLLALLKQRPDAKKLKVLTRHFTYEPVALALARNDDDFRLAVDRALSGFLALPQFGELYAATFGVADDDTIEFFRSLPR